MTEYVDNLTSGNNALRREAERNLQRVVDGDGFTIVDGVMRWDSNGNVVPKEWVDLAIHAGLPADAEASDAVRDAEFAVFLAEYREMRKNRTPEQIEEERFEARAAHGPGVELVNVLTGETFTT